MRNFHRKTLIRREGWPQIDDWYWCPLPVIEERIVKERKRVNRASKITTFSLRHSFNMWIKRQMKLESRLAHACDDGRIRAPSGWGIEYFKGKGGTISIYGKCSHCEKPLSDGIKGIIIMEKEL